MSDKKSMEKEIRRLELISADPEVNEKDRKIANDRISELRREIQEGCI